MTLTSLPDLNFCETDTATVEASVILAYESITGKKLYPGDPVRLFLESLAMVVVMQRVIIDTSAKQNLLAFATGEKLDHLGALTGTSRLVPAPASAVFRFCRQSPGSAPVLIPAGTRVTPDQTLLFTTLDTCEIPAGKTSAETTAECVTPGEIGNGFLPGQVAELSDPLAGVDRVENITETSGGSDHEDDDHFRERIHLSPERFTTAGTRGGYEYWAKTAHPDIADVAVHSPEPGMVDVYALLKDGQIPDQFILDLVRSVLNDDAVIPLTDTCRVLPPTPVECEVDITWYLAAKDSAMAATVQAGVATAVNEFSSWQGSALGRDINPTELIHRVRQAGAVRVEVAAPAHRTLETWQTADIRDIRISFGGLE